MVLLATIIFKGGVCCSIDGRGKARLRIVDQCEENAKGDVALSSRRVPDEVKDFAAVAQCVWQQDGILRDVMFARMIDS